MPRVTALLLVASVTACVVTLGLIYRGGLSPFSLGAVVQFAALSPLTGGQVGLPIRLRIPAIGVDAMIEHVGLTPSGLVDVPKDRFDVAWFKLGPRPGEAGVAVIDGHFGWQAADPAVFDNLHTLEPGDKIYIENVHGTATIFVVRALHTYGRDEQVPDVFNATDGRAHLTLITCEGVWDPKAESYMNRLVVFADRQ